MNTLKLGLWRFAGSITAMAAAAIVTSASAWTTDAVRTEPPFDLNQDTLVPFKYQSLEPKQLTKKWSLCVLMPHTDNPFMLSVLYGAISEAQEMGVSVEAKSAGGYTNVSRQIDQLEDCVTRGVNAVVLIAVSPTGLNDAIADAINHKVVVIDTINGVTSDKITGRVVTSYRRIGQTFGKYLADKHPKGSGTASVLYMAGPAGATYVEFMKRGFTEAIAGSDIKVVKDLYADSSKAAQLPVVEDGLLAYPKVNYVAGNAPAIEAAHDVLREKGRTDVKLIAGFVTPAVLDLVEQGAVMATVSASEVIQPKLAIDMALRALEGKLEVRDAAPNSFIIDQSNVKTFDKTTTVAPANWSPVFNVN